MAMPCFCSKDADDLAHLWNGCKGHLTMSAECRSGHVVVIPCLLTQHGLVEPARAALAIVEAI